MKNKFKKALDKRGVWVVIYSGTPSGGTGGKAAQAA